MKSKLFSALVLASSLALFNCSVPEKHSESAAIKPEPSQEELISRG